jgi:hypothetical protein
MVCRAEAQLANMTTAVAIRRTVLHTNVMASDGGSGGLCGQKVAEVDIETVAAAVFFL